MRFAERVGFAISRPALERLANEVLASPEGTTQIINRRCGIYWVSVDLGQHNRLKDQHVDFIISGTGYINQFGFRFLNPAATTQPVEATSPVIRQFDQ